MYRNFLLAPHEVDSSRVLFQIGVSIALFPLLFRRCPSVCKLSKAWKVSPIRPPIFDQKTWAVYSGKSRVLQLLLHLIECIAHKEIRHKAPCRPQSRKRSIEERRFSSRWPPKAPNGDWSLWNRARRTSVPEIWVPRGIKYARTSMRKASDFANRDCEIVFIARSKRINLQSRLIARV